VTNGPWKLADLNAGRVGAKSNGLRVFSCFHCGGGSSMGYKLAGFKVIGGVEIDPEMMHMYRQNLAPDLAKSFLMDVQEFNAIKDAKIPQDLFDIDILDGSPPCSSFSMAGAREEGWGKEKKFREGQTVQVLDDLFMHFVNTAKKLRPKVVIAENVTGMMIGDAKGYVKEVIQAFTQAGYDTQVFQLNAAMMGVPQARRRIFFVASRRDLGMPKVSLSFNESPVTVLDSFRGIEPNLANTYPTEHEARMWRRCMPGEAFSKHNDGNGFNHHRLHGGRSARTIASHGVVMHPTEMRKLAPIEFIRLQSFPDDYDFCDQSAQYVCGMSVPPFMMERVSSAIAHQLFGMT
jgi:DNA (cytosine-5)-methyltransferase 1